ncbi:hypothetical protein AC630_37040 [Bradyrhizobium sp. AS23.2]|nr:hypothetical protein AC630_37040 [Bradyrhizobium sp. AS23.2]
MVSELAKKSLLLGDGSKFDADTANLKLQLVSFRFAEEGDQCFVGDIILPRDEMIRKVFPAEDVFAQLCSSSQAVKILRCIQNQSLAPKRFKSTLLE